jgi:EAL domain-containing protein (putative c-di-GMP-specific phosphodiesterase class I)
VKVIAEGVDSDQQSYLLKLLRCDEAQGFLFSRPLPPERVEALLAAA